jgi:hypothetical protein
MALRARAELNGIETPLPHSTERPGVFRARPRREQRAMIEARLRDHLLHLPVVVSQLSPAWQ